MSLLRIAYRTTAAVEVRLRLRIAVARLAADGRVRTSHRPVFAPETPERKPPKRGDLERVDLGTQRWPRPPGSRIVGLRATPVGLYFLSHQSNYAADAPSSVERVLLLCVQAVVKRLKLGLDFLPAGKPSLRHLFGQRHSACRRRKIYLVSA